MREGLESYKSRVQKEFDALAEENLVLLSQLLSVNRKVKKLEQRKEQADLVRQAFNTPEMAKLLDLLSAEQEPDELDSDAESDVSDQLNDLRFEPGMKQEGATSSFADREEKLDE